MTTYTIDELLKVTYGVWDHIKNHGDHGVDVLADRLERRTPPMAEPNARPATRSSKRAAIPWTR